MRLKRSTWCVAGLLVLGTALSACSEPENNASSGDGDQLKIGYILPETGAIAFLGPQMIGGVELGAEDVNAAGGVLGSDLELVGADEGDADGATAVQSADRLVNSEHVAAIVGTAASGVALAIIDQVTGAQVLMCSPGNSSPTFTDYEDDGYYFRTKPSDELLGPVLAQAIVEDGNSKIALLSRGDAFGQAVTTATRAAIESTYAGDAEVVADESYPPDGRTFDSEVRAVAAAKPDAIVVVSFDEGARVLSALIEAGFGPEDVDIYLTSGNRNEELAEQVSPGHPDALEGVKGASSAAASFAPFVERLNKRPNIAGTVNADTGYDCVVLLALAAEQLGEVDPPAMRQAVQEVSTGGEKCDSYKECKELLESGVEDIDYDGISGPIELDDNGDPQIANFEIWQFQADGSIEVVTTTQMEMVE